MFFLCWNRWDKKQSCEQEQETQWGWADKWERVGISTTFNPDCNRTGQIYEIWEEKHKADDRHIEPSNHLFTQKIEEQEHPNQSWIACVWMMFGKKLNVKKSWGNFKMGICSKPAFSAKRARFHKLPTFPQQGNSMLLFSKPYKPKYLIEKVKDTPTDSNW